MKSKIMDMILINCISYTTLSVVISLLSFVTNVMMEASHFVYLSLFIVTTLISLLIAITSFIKTESFFIENIIIFIDILVVVYGVGGGMFHWFPWNWIALLEAGMICVVVFFVTGLVMYGNDRIVAMKINQKIGELNDEDYRH